MENININPTLDYLATNNSGNEFSIIKTKRQSVLTMTPGFTIEFEYPMPNRWWRFWQWIFFGFEWHRWKR